MDLINYKIKLPLELLDIIDSYNKENIIGQRKVCQFYIYDNIDGYYDYQKICTSCYYNDINNCQHYDILNNHFINETVGNISIMDIDYEYFQNNHRINNILFYKYLPYYKFKQLKHYNMIDIIENHYGKLQFFI